MMRINGRFYKFRVSMVILELKEFVQQRFTCSKGFDFHCCNGSHVDQSYKVVPQFVNAKLVNITSKTMAYG